MLAIAAISARSVALAGFGLDSPIEIGASVAVIWELAGTGLPRQRRALRLIGSVITGTPRAQAARGQPRRKARRLARRAQPLTGPLWDAQLDLWTPKAISEGLNTRQIGENVVLNLATTRPDLLTEAAPATGKPAPYGSGHRRRHQLRGHQLRGHRLHRQLAPPPPSSQFPPR